MTREGRAAAEAPCFLSYSGSFTATAASTILPLRGSCPESGVFSAGTRYGPGAAGGGAPLAVGGRLCPKAEHGCSADDVRRGPLRGDRPAGVAARARLRGPPATFRCQLRVLRLTPQLLLSPVLLCLPRHGRLLWLPRVRVRGRWVPSCPGSHPPEHRAHLGQLLPEA